MSEMVIVAKRERADGFKLAGFNVLELTDENIEESLSDLVFDSSFGLIVVEDELYNCLGKSLLRRIHKGSKALVRKSVV